MKRLILIGTALISVFLLILIGTSSSQAKSWTQVQSESQSRAQTHSQNENQNQNMDTEQNQDEYLGQDQVEIQMQTEDQSQNQAATGITSYVALGDSIAAGAGLPVATGSSTDSICGRSNQAYPNQVAASLGTTVTNLACTGAKVDEGIYGEQERGGYELPPQLDQAFLSGVPDLITVTIGANDVRWSQFIQSCYAWTCDTKTQSALAKVYRADLRYELARMFTEIEKASGDTPPTVLISGYFAPFSNLDCVETDRITPAEQAWLKRQVNSLNQAIKSVARHYSFVEYVPIDFTGHELCSADSWVQGIDAPAPFHPTAAGQTAIAEAFVEAIPNN